MKPRNALVPGAGRDHRKQVGQQRSARMRERIIRTALPVFAAKGPDAPVIDDFIRAADIARGTFYRHFRTVDALRAATAAFLEESVMQAIEDKVRAIERPDMRLATGVRTWLTHARRNPVLCAFIVRNHVRVRIVERRVATDIGAGMRAGHFQVGSVSAGRDLLIGTIREAMARMMDGSVSRRYVDNVAASILQGLGLGSAAVRELMVLPLPRI
jgi:AcrR family transcriptional regulator